MDAYALTAAPITALPAQDFKDDPVTKALYDNIMGKLPTKKPKVSVWCKLCKLEFSSQAVLDTHVAGVKHQRKVKSKEMMQNMPISEPGIERNSSGAIHCSLCDITLNSPQLLETHVAGNKHQSKKGKRVNGEEGEGETPAKKLCSADETKTNGDAKATESGGANATPKEKVAPPPKKVREPLNIDIPSCVTKLEDNKTGGKFLCNPCQAHCNSDIQLSQHLKSKKHIDKLSGKKLNPIPSTRGAGGNRTSWKSIFGRGKTTSSSRNYSTNLPTTASWDTFSSGLALQMPSTNGNYVSSYTDSSLASGFTSAYTDSYGLSSLGRGVTDYTYDRSLTSAPARSTSVAAVARNTTSRVDPYARTDSYGRVASPYTRADLYERADYGTEYTVARADDLSSYSRAATEYAAAADYAHSYSAASQSLAAAPANASRGVHFTYTAPLSHNFVAGGSIL